MISVITQCRICKNNNLVDVINLGDHVLSCRFPETTEEKIPKCSLILTKCTKDINNPDNGVCNLVQLKYSVNSEELYLHDYGYRSGINNTMTTHLKNLVLDIENLYVNDLDTILDIGSNDATLLKFYKKKVNLIGIDPTGNQFKEYYPSNITLVPDFFSKELYLLSNLPKPKVITSLSMFYDLPDPLKFVSHIKDILRDDGVWIMEQSYLPYMLETLSFDTICHEHLEYYSLEQIQWLVDKYGLKIIDVTLNDCNGGSFRVTITHKNNMLYDINQNNINILIEKEKHVNDIGIFNDFMKKCNNIKTNLMEFLQNQHQNNKKICIYGASTKGNTLLQYFGIDNKLISCIAEKNINKYGKYTPGSLIPIVSEEEVRKINPDFMLVLPWHFKKEFIIRETDFLNNGGQLIFPLPSIDIVSNYDKMIITGISGQIGSYLLDLLLKKNNNMLIYGIFNETKKIQNHKNVFYLEKDLTTPLGIENIMTMLLSRNHTKNYIVNLAGITNAQVSITNPIKTLELNGIVPMRICETILKINKNIKFFQASSSEMYKGFNNCNIENLNNFYPKNPYGIAKITAHLSVSYYREFYGLFVCSGILFNTESPLRKEEFFSKKICNGVKKIRDNKDNEIIEPIKINNVNSYRDWIHAYDTANAIISILDHDKPNDYIISLSDLNSIKDFINMAFYWINIKLTWDDKGAYDNDTSIRYIIYDNILNRTYENKIEKISGSNQDLLNIGWEPRFDLDLLILDMISS